MYLRFVFILFIFVVSVTGCRRKKQNVTEYPVIIDIKEALRNKRDFKLSDLVDSITYIPIDGIISDYDYPFLSSHHIKISRNYIISENAANKDLLCFNKDGRFLRKIARKGKGPGEYLRIDDIAIDEDIGVIFVFSSNNQKIFKYSLDGSFLGAIRLSEDVDGIIGDSGRLLVHYPNWRGNVKYSCLLLNQNFDTANILRNHISYKLNIKRNYWLTECIYYIYNNRIHIKDKCDTLFWIENNHFYPKYVFFTGDSHSITISQTEYDKKIPFRYIHETDSKVFFEFRWNEEWYSAYYDKHIGKAFSSSSIINNDLDDVDNYYFFPHHCQYNDEILMGRNAEFDREKLKNKVSPSKYQRITNMLDQLTDEDINMLIIMHLKK